ncbi:MAG: DUF4091 domain-containing protein [Clostridia bacterium]|nr:DUF4091 domain-containing protein [Clostridia bacterium]
MLNTKLLHSLQRVFPNDCPQNETLSLSGVRNERLSFQLAYRMKDPQITTPIFIQIESELPINLYATEFVPVKHTGAAGFENPPAIGLYPDILCPKATNPEIQFLNVPGTSKRYNEKGENYILNASGDCWQSIWFNINEQEKIIPAGEFTVTLHIFDAMGRNEVETRKMTVKIEDAVLPEQTLIYTNWLHCDCICDLHHVAIFSEEFWRILESYLQTAATFGMNMVLMPAFTPELDTPIGTERMTVQLVDVGKTQAGYRFDFSKMKRFAALCKKVGIQYLEHAHLFSQWGATAAPKIVDTDGNLLFGWETDAAGEEYGKFLKEYLNALLAFLKQEDLEQSIFFHISDEPKDFMLEAYQKATEQVRELLKDFNSGDALSHYCFYEDGTVKTPIVRTKAIDEFAGRCDNMWAYYTGNDVQDGLSNRILTVPPERNRIMGIQLYQYKMKGFLHWGLNYYYDVLSNGIFDPRTNPCGYRNHAGTSFFVYPNFDGTASPSMRQVVFGDGLNDYRSLQALEQKHGRRFCEKLIEKYFGKMTVHTLPETPETILNFRAELNQLLV